ncbi:MAG: DEAD/DEAH box helicase family protein [Actinobacteria bacterium]|nr:DEAD/DEAH box helicase family protein [Actinomycetota bacterium]
MINRYSSRATRLDKQFLNDKLHNAKSYDRIAGYFSSSVLEIAGEAIESISGKVRLICNSQIEKEDCATATAAASALRREWCENKPEKIYASAIPRLKLLYEFMKSGKLEIKVLPNNVFGLIHGKAGVIALADGSKTSFIGSVNETLSAWRLNYEMLWEDNSPEAIEWVQNEFDYFWQHPSAIPMSDFVMEDIGRISQREVIDDIAKWKEMPEPAQAVVESPVYREELGLWEHQKYFADMAFRNHRKSYGARFVLADQVGLGKTIQLALSAQLMALWGNKPVLIIVPKTLIWQWQDEMRILLDMPSAAYNGREWVDENGIKYPQSDDIRKCPRRVGIISQGIIINGREEYLEQLLSMQYGCVIVDESHRSRRKNLGDDKENLKPEPNNLYDFLLKISLRTHSMLLSTATPVQMYPIEAWDLLNILSQKNDSVLGSDLSKWRKDPKRTLDLIMDKAQTGNSPTDWLEQCEWLRNPFPPSEEDELSFGGIRRRLRMEDDNFIIKPEQIKAMHSTPEGRKVSRILEDGFIQNHNPFIRHIVRRTRDFLENNNNPETGEPYLKKIEVILMGEKDSEGVLLPRYLQDAYSCAEEFCKLLGSRVRGTGFVETLLLKRVGSTMLAGRKTAEKMINWGNTDEDFFEEDDDDLGTDEKRTDAQANKKTVSTFKDITEAEKNALARFIKILDENTDKDPKYALVLNLLTKEGFKDKGCIIFSQYFDSAYWVAENLSNDLKDVPIGLYAGDDKSGIMRDGKYHKHTREDIKRMVRTREIKILVGTDAASEGLNLQTLGTLINLDLPWNPTRLEQRKGRIQRIGQQSDKVLIYNMRYKGSVEDRVHYMLSKRLQNISDIFGQLPDVLEDVWVQVALGKKADAEKIIDAVPMQHPFKIKYEKQAVSNTNWEDCRIVLNESEKRKCLLDGWR